MARKASSFSRQTPRLKKQPLVSVLCEDSKSGLLYLKDAARYFRSYAEVEIAHCDRTDPKGIVVEAIKRQAKFDNVYCVIDRDSHETFDEALALAKTSAKVIVLPSYPCYEFWLLLHFRKSRKAYKTTGNATAGDRMVSALREESGMDGYAKGVSAGLFESLLGRLPSARLRAAQVLAEAESDGGINPSTRLHELIDRFEALGVPQAIA